MTPDVRAVVDLVRSLVEGGRAAPARADWIRRHGLAPLAFRHGLVELRADYATSAIRWDQQRAIATEAVGALRGTPVLLLKGISYAGWLYDDPGERPMSDVDLLVPLEHHAEAVHTLGRLGYWHPGPAMQRSSRHHAMTLKRRDASIDLHRSVAQRGRLAIDWPALWARTLDAPWIPGARRLDPVDEILFHFAHLARQDLIAPLLGFVDAGRLLARLGDRATLHDRARQWRFARVLDACLAVTEHVLAGRDGRPRWWLPSTGDLVERERPARSVQIGRKLLLVEGPRELAALGAAVLDGWRFS